MTNRIPTFQLVALISAVAGLTLILMAQTADAQTVWLCNGQPATIVGSPFDDTINGTNGDDIIVARQGDDIIKGGGGNDIICGGKGNDTIYGGAGFDIIYAAQGNDTLYSAAGSTSAARADTRGARMFGGAGNDTIYGSNRWDRMQGGLGNDSLYGFEGRDWQRGGGGNDHVDGGTGIDDLHGGNGRDTIELTNGDKVKGGAGFDLCNLVSGSPGSIRSCGLNEREGATLPVCGDPAACRHPQAQLATYYVDVLSIRFIPDENNDGIVDPEISGINGSMRVNELRERIDTMETKGAWWATEATRYRGHSNNVVPSIGFRISMEREKLVGPPQGLPVPWNDAYRPDYRSILSGYDICNLVDNQGIDEVWMYTQHHGSIEPVESNMSSKVGDYSNSELTNDLPLCDRSYVLYNFNYTRGVAEMLHNRGHQVEAQMGRRKDGAAHPDNQLFFNEFVGSRTTGAYTNPVRCGDVHYPPNTNGDEYVTWLPDTVQTDCATWGPEGGRQATVSCATWFEAAYGDPTCYNDGGLSYTVWWMQNLPGRDSELQWQGKSLRNWWAVMADFDAVMKQRTWLTQ